MIVGADSRKPWSDMDRLIMHAYQVIQDERCQQCGMPVWLCHSTDQQVQVRIKVDRCIAKDELDKFEEGRREGDKAGAAYPEFYTRDDSPLHLQRDKYYERLIAEREDADSD